MRSRFFAVLVAYFALASGAGAASLDLAASDLGDNTVDFSSPAPGQLAIDPHFTTATPMTLAIVLGAEDGDSIAWNALVDNLTGEVWSAFEIEIVGGSLQVGSATANAGQIAGIFVELPPRASALVAFDPAEPAGFDLGAPFGTGTDWGFQDLDGTFLLRLSPVPVPEPGTLGAIGIGLVALAARRSGIVRARNA